VLWRGIPPGPICSESTDVAALATTACHDGKRTSCSESGAIRARDGFAAWAAGMTSTAAALLMDRLGLTEDELCRALGVDPLSVIAGDLDDKPQLPILLALTEEAAERVGPGLLRRWVRASGPAGRPVDHLVAQDYAAFEDALGELAERGFVLRRSRG
jgi:hypothetical protein